MRQKVKADGFYLYRRPVGDAGDGGENKRLSGRRAKCLLCKCVCVCVYVCMCRWLLHVSLDSGNVGPIFWSKK